MPLSDVRVLDLTRLLPGPFATQILADFGAEVIKVEAPGSADLMRFLPPWIGGESYPFQQVNHNKKSLVLDLKHPAGRDALLDLAERCDVVVEGFRPGVMERLGLTPEVFRERNPQLVVASLSGYGQTGPRRAHPGHDINYQGYAGSLVLNADAAGTPVVSAVQAADLSGALYTVIGMLLALRKPGQDVDVGMLDTVFALMSIHTASAFAGEPLGPGDSPLSGSLPNYGVYRCADGRFLAVGSLEPKFFAGLCAALEVPALAAVDVTDPEQRDRARAMLGGLFGTRPRDAWLTQLEDAGLCVGPVLEQAEAAEDPQLCARGMVRRLDDPTLGSVAIVGSPIKLSQSPPLPLRAAPKKGEHTREILAGLGYSAERVEALFAEGAAG